MKRIELKQNERLDDLIHAELKIIQSEDYFSFSIDAVLLADFINFKAGARIIDLGTGSGVIPLLLTAKGSPEELVGVEIQAELVDMARRSVKYNALENLIKIRNLNIKDLAVEYQAEEFDLLVSNPPYLPLGQGKLSPKYSIALAKHEVKIELEELVKVSAYLVKYGGAVFYIYRAARLAEILELMRTYNLEPKTLRFIYPKLKAEANLVLISGVKGGAQGLRVERPLIIYENDNNYTEEVLEIYDLHRR